MRSARQLFSGVLACPFGVVQVTGGRYGVQRLGLDDHGRGEHVPGRFDGPPVVGGAAGHDELVHAAHGPVERGDDRGLCGQGEFVQTVQHRQDVSAGRQDGGRLRAQTCGAQRRVVLGQPGGQPVVQNRERDGVPAGHRQQHRDRLIPLSVAGGQQFEQ